jgi:hypothetical protein
MSHFTLKLLPHHINGCVSVLPSLFHFQKIKEKDYSLENVWRLARF